MRETDTWPEGREFETLQPMMRITLNAILRTVFGAQGNAFDELRQLLPPMVPLASRIAVMPPVVRRDLGPTAQARPKACGSSATDGAMTKSSHRSSAKREPTRRSRTATTCSH